MSKKIIALILSIVLVLSFSIILTVAETSTVTTAAEFYAKIEAGESVKLGADICMNRTAYLDSGDVSIDLNGYDIFTDNGADWFELIEIESLDNPSEEEKTPTKAEVVCDDWDCAYLFRINGANLTVIDTSNGDPGTINVNIKDTSNQAIFGLVAGTLNVSKVMLDQTSDDGNIVDAFGGTLIFDDTRTRICDDYACLDLDVNATFKNCNIAYCDETAFYPYYYDEDTDSIFTGSLLVDNCTVTECGCAFVSYGFEGTVTVNGGSYTSCYNTIYSEGGTYILNDCKFTETAYNTIFCDSFCGESNITINGGTYTANYCTVYCQGGNITINDGNFTAGNRNCIYINNQYNFYGEDNKLTINGGTFTNAEDNDGYATIYSFMPNGYTYNDKLVDIIPIVINGGEFTNENSYGISGNGSLTINNATITSADVAVNWWGDYLRICDGTFDGGYSGLWFDYEADVELSGGTYIGHAVGSYSSSGGICTYYTDTKDIKDFVAEGYTIYDTDETHKVTYTSASGDDPTPIDDSQAYLCTEDKVVIAPLKAEILKGDASYTKGSNENVVVSSNISLSLFDSVLVDGKTVSADNYEATSGSTIITFKPAYLETLSVGKHEVTIVSKAGTTELKATTTLTIVAAETEETEEIADTADNSMIGAFVALSAFAAAGYVTLKKHED